MLGVYLRETSYCGVVSNTHLLSFSFVALLFLPGLIQSIGQLLDGEFAPSNLHDRNTRNLAQAATQILIIGRHNVNSMLGHLQESLARCATQEKFE